MLLYIVLVIAYCYVLDSLWDILIRRSFRTRVRELRAKVRANLAARGKRHV